MELERHWPPGGSDLLLDELAEAYIDDSNKLDFRGVLGDRRLGRIALVSSFGGEAAVLLHMVAEVNPALPIIFLDTLRHFGETLAYRDSLVAHLQLTNVRSIRPSETMLSEEDPSGNLSRSNPDACCTLRKTFPLQDALDGFDTWITGRKRAHGGTRANLPYFERDGRHIKINPLILFDPPTVDAYFATHSLPRHPLLARGYKSIGCAPCTNPVNGRDDHRAGRWAGLEKTECGIHLGPDGRFVRGVLKS